MKVFCVMKCYILKYEKDYLVNGYFLCGMLLKGCVVGKDNF